MGHLTGILTVLGGTATMMEPVKGFDQLRSQVRKGLPYATLEAVLEGFNLSRDAFSTILHLPLRTLARRRNERRLHPDESDRLVRLARVLAQGVEVLGSKEKVSQWLQRPNRALGGETPLALLDTDLGTRQVEEVLGRLAFGVYS